MQRAGDLGGLRGHYLLFLYVDLPKVQSKATRFNIEAFISTVYSSERLHFCRHGCVVKGARLLGSRHEDKRRSTRRRWR